MKKIRHSYPQFRIDNENAIYAFAQERSFGAFMVPIDGRILIAHAPFYLDTDKKALYFHLHRGNSIIDAFDHGNETALVINGPDAYISPDWYEVDGNPVPTWNYTAIHLRGSVQKLPQDQIDGVLANLSATFEERIHDKVPWRQEKMDAAYRTRLLRAITPFKMEIKSVDGIQKIGQDKPVSAISNAAAGVRRAGIGLAAADLAYQMETLGAATHKENTL